MIHLPRANSVARLSAEADGGDIPRLRHLCRSPASLWPLLDFTATTNFVSVALVLKLNGSA
jgi:hypothetical protein